MQIKGMGGFFRRDRRGQTLQTIIDRIDYYRRDRHLIDKINYYGQDGRNGQHEAGQATEETRHLLVEMLNIQQYEDF